jgi:hypothetical protein
MLVCVCVTVDASAQSVPNELRVRESDWQSVAMECGSTASIINEDAAAVADDDAGILSWMCVLHWL